MKCLIVCFLQLNAKTSYLKEDQENLRLSVKAIAVSVSNAIDRAETDRLLMKTINDSIADLQTRTKEHYYRLNDHILKVRISYMTHYCPCFISSIFLHLTNLSGTRFTNLFFTVFELSVNFKRI